MGYVLINTANAFFTVMYVMLFARIILSWFSLGRSNRLLELLFIFTEPILAPIRSLLNRSPLGGPGMMLDFSPIIAFLLLRIANSFVVALLRTL